MKEELNKKITQFCKSIGDYPILQKTLLDSTIQQAIVDAHLYEGYVLVDTMYPPHGTTVIVTDGLETACATFYRGLEPQPWKDFKPKGLAVKAWTYFPKPADLSVLRDQPT